MKYLLVFAFFVFLLYGCNATGPVSGVCGFLPIGQNEQGATFFRYQCQPNE